MIPNHKQFIQAITEKHKVCLRFYSIADSAVIDLVCAPIDYGPGTGVQPGVNRYWFWDYARNTGSSTLGLLPDQVLDVRVLGEVFDPSDFGPWPAIWSIPRDWQAPPASNTDSPPTGSPQSEKRPVLAQASHLDNK
jgi:hypothetical protein